MRATPWHRKSAGPAVADTPTDGTTRSVRVDTTRIDALVDLVGELIVAKNNLEHLAAQAAIVDPSLSRALAVNLSGFERLTGEMHRAVMHLRMTPLSRTFSRFPRWMRDTAGKLGKTVNFEIADEEVEADKAVVDGLFEPLLHVLRNAVDHGIEDAGMRRAAGKPAVGRIALEARPDGDQIVVAISDDGAGLDPVKLRAVAKLKGLMSDEALNALDDAAVADLIFTPGFSTADSITDISGRGVGMDAVRTGRRIPRWSRLHCQHIRLRHNCSDDVAAGRSRLHHRNRLRRRGTLRGAARGGGRNLPDFSGSYSADTQRRGVCATQPDHPFGAAIGYATITGGPTKT